MLVYLVTQVHGHAAIKSESCIRKWNKETNDEMRNYSNSSEAVAYLENLSGRGQNAKSSLGIKYTGNKFHHNESH